MSTFILKQVKVKVHIDTLPMYRYAGGSKEKRSIVQNRTYTVKLRFDGEMPDGSLGLKTLHNIDTVKDNTKYIRGSWKGIGLKSPGDLEEYTWPDLTNSKGLVGIVVEGVHYKTVSDWNWRIAAEVEKFDPKTGLTYCDITVSGREQYFSFECSVIIDLEDPAL